MEPYARWRVVRREVGSAMKNACAGSQFDIVDGRFRQIYLLKV
jgi:hypothetical protein